MFRRAVVTPDSIQEQTESNLEFIESDARYRKRVLQDRKRSERLKSQNCVACFYSPPIISCAVITESQCAFCDKKIRSGSSCVDIMCPSCAQVRDLCCHCGGELELNRAMDKA